MKIFLIIIGALTLTIAAALFLPIYVILKTDQNGEFEVRFKFLGKVFGDEPNPKPSRNNALVDALKKAAGLSRLEKKRVKTHVKKAGVFDTVKESFDLILDLLKKIVELLRRCVIKKLRLKIVCAKEDAADTAISYGRYCAVVNPALAFIHNFMKVKERGKDISITCDYNGGEEKFELELVLYARVFRVLGALIGIVLQEAQRVSEGKLKKDAARRKKSTDTPPKK